MVEKDPALRTLPLLREAARVVLRVWRPLLAYGVLAQLAFTLVIAPLLLWLLAGTLELARSAVVVNYDLASLAVSPAGLLLAFLWAIAVSLAGVLLAGGAVVIAAAHLEGRTIPLGNVVLSVLGTIHRIPGRGALLLGAYIFLLIPLFAAGATMLVALLLAPFDAGPVEHWIPDEVRELQWIVPAMILLFAAAGYLYVRWSLTLQCFILERVSLTRAVKRSATIVRGRYWLVARVLFLRILGFAVLLGVVSFLLGLVDWAVLAVAKPEEGTFFRYLVAGVAVLNVSALAVVSALGVVQQVTAGTVLYRRLTGDAALPFPDSPARVYARWRRFAGVAAMLLLFGAAFLRTLPEVDQELNELDRAIAVTAHRGSSGEAPENTLAALRLAVEDGADFAEIDVQQAADGAIVVLHDVSLKRVAGVDRAVWEMTLPELKELDVGRWFDERYAGERIPTFAQALDVAKGRIGLNIEVKVHGREKDLAPAVVDLIRAADFEEECVITSLDYGILKEIRVLQPELRLGMIVTARVGRLDRLDVDFYSTQPNLATFTFIRDAHESGREVHVWTLNDPRRMSLFADRGVDAIITDYPRVAVSLLKARTEGDEFYAAITRLFRRS